MPSTERSDIGSAEMRTNRRSTKVEKTAAFRTTAVGNAAFRQSVLNTVVEAVHLNESMSKRSVPSLSMPQSCVAAPSKARLARFRTPLYDESLQHKQSRLVSYSKLYHAAGILPGDVRDEIFSFPRQDCNGCSTLISLFLLAVARYGVDWYILLGRKRHSSRFKQVHLEESEDELEDEQNVDELRVQVLSFFVECVAY